MKAASFRKLIYLYLSLPVLIFLLGWLKWYFALTGAGALILSFRYLYGKNHYRNCPAGEEEGGSYRIDKRTLLLAVSVALLWCFLAGQGGYFYQSNDHNARNAIFRDLIMKEWPVLYPEQNMGLVYYIGHWLVPALFGKACIAAGLSHAAWSVANTALYLWSSLGITIVCLLVFMAVRADTRKKQIIAAIVLIFFSGLDAVGIVFQSITNHRLILINHIESWSTIAEYSSLTTCLFWVYNQTIVPWIVILLYLCKERIQNYAYLGILCILYGPLPALGLLPFLIGRAAKEFFCGKGIKEKILVLRNIFSIPNILSVTFLLPILFLYLKGNYALSSTGIGYANRSPWGLIKTLLVMALFVALEYGIYALILWKYCHKRIDYRLCVVSLTAILFFQVGMGSDFTMRVSIPAIMVLMILTLRVYLQMIGEKKASDTCIRNDEKKQKRLKLPVVFLTAAFLIGAVTPAVEYARAFASVIEEKKLAVTADEMQTLEGQKEELLVNFVTFRADEDTFFKYIAR